MKLPVQSLCLFGRNEDLSRHRGLSSLLDARPLGLCVSDLKIFAWNLCSALRERHADSGAPHGALELATVSLGGDDQTACLLPVLERTGHCNGDDARGNPPPPVAPSSSPAVPAVATAEPNAPTVVPAAGAAAAAPVAHTVPASGNAAGCRTQPLSSNSAAAYLGASVSTSSCLSSSSGSTSRVGTGGTGVAPLRLTMTSCDGDGSTCVGVSVGVGVGATPSSPGHQQTRTSRAECRAAPMNGWCRAPEQLMGMPYGTPADVFAVGCILAELATGQPLFPGACTEEQLRRMARLLGPMGHNPRRQSEAKDGSPPGADGSPRACAVTWGKGCSGGDIGTRGAVAEGAFRNPGGGGSRAAAAVGPVAPASASVSASANAAVGEAHGTAGRAVAAEEGAAGIGAAAAAATALPALRTWLLRQLVQEPQTGARIEKGSGSTSLGDEPSPEAAGELFADLLEACLQPDPAARPTAEQILKMPYFTSCRGSQPGDAGLPSLRAAYSVSAVGTAQGAVAAVTELSTVTPPAVAQKCKPTTAAEAAASAATATASRRATWETWMTGSYDVAAATTPMTPSCTYDCNDHAARRQTSRLAPSTWVIGPQGESPPPGPLTGQRPTQHTGVPDKLSPPGTEPGPAQALASAPLPEVRLPISGGGGTWPAAARALAPAHPPPQVIEVEAGACRSVATAGSASAVPSAGLRRSKEAQFGGSAAAAAVTAAGVRAPDGGADARPRLVRSRSRDVRGSESALDLPLMLLQGSPRAAARYQQRRPRRQSPERRSLPLFLQRDIGMVQELKAAAEELKYNLAPPGQCTMDADEEDVIHSTATTATTATTAAAAAAITPAAVTAALDISATSSRPSSRLALHAGTQRTSGSNLMSGVTPIFARRAGAAAAAPSPLVIPDGAAYSSSFGGGGGGGAGGGFGGTPPGTYASAPGGLFRDAFSPMGCRTHVPIALIAPQSQLPQEQGPRGGDARPYQPYSPYPPDLQHRTESKRPRQHQQFYRRISGLSLGDGQPEYDRQWTCAEAAAALIAHVPLRPEKDDCRCGRSGPLPAPTLSPVVRYHARGLDADPRGAQAMHLQLTAKQQHQQHQQQHQQQQQQQHQQQHQQHLLNQQQLEVMPPFGQLPVAMGSSRSARRSNSESQLGSSPGEPWVDAAFGSGTGPGCVGGRWQGARQQGARCLSALREAPMGPGGAYGVSETGGEELDEEADPGYVAGGSRDLWPTLSRVRPRSARGPVVYGGGLAGAGYGSGAGGKLHSEGGGRGPLPRLLNVLQRELIAQHQQAPSGNSMSGGGGGGGGGGGRAHMPMDSDLLRRLSDVCESSSSEIRLPVILSVTNGGPGGDGEGDGDAGGGGDAAAERRPPEFQRELAALVAVRNGTASESGGGDGRGAGAGAAVGVSALSPAAAATAKGLAQRARERLRQYFSEDGSAASVAAAAAGGCGNTAPSLPVCSSTSGDSGAHCGGDGDGTAGSGAASCKAGSKAGGKRALISTLSRALRFGSSVKQRVAPDKKPR